MKDPLELLFPRKCPFCRRLLKSPTELLCGDCRETLERTGSDCRSRGSFFSVCVSPLWYEGAAREALLRFKFSGKRSYARCFGQLMAECLRAGAVGRYDLIAYVPLHFLRLRTRGYSQTKLLAEALSKETGVPCVPLLRKKRHTRAQSGMVGEAARKANVSGAFAVRKNAAVAGKTVLLADDVLTTGATLSECSRVLLTAGADKVVCVTLCKARDPKKDRQTGR